MDRFDEEAATIWNGIDDHLNSSTATICGLFAVWGRNLVGDRDRRIEDAIKLADAVKAYRSATSYAIPPPPSRQEREREAFSKMMIALIPFEDQAKELKP